jgi:hypothetical protein
VTAAVSSRALRHSRLTTRPNKLYTSFVLGPCLGNMESVRESCAFLATMLMICHILHAIC